METLFGTKKLTEETLREKLTLHQSPDVEEVKDEISKEEVKDEV